jgi:hypothetical protein
MVSVERGESMAGALKRVDVTYTCGDCGEDFTVSIDIEGEDQYTVSDGEAHEDCSADI